MRGAVIRGNFFDTTKDRQPPAVNGHDTDGLTEDGLALAFAQLHEKRLRYCHDTGAWFLWNGSIWRRENTRRAFNWAREVVRDSLATMKAAYPAEAKFSRAAVAAAVEKFAQADRAFAVTADIWDADIWQLGTPGGTVDLKTGQLRQAERGDYITKVTAVAPAESPDCPLWLKFLDEACAHDAGYIRFLRQWCGYSLTGSIEEHALLFLHGDGGNGKGVFLNTIAGIMTDYCKTAAMDTFIASKGDRHPTDLAALKGARMVCASETEEGRAWSELRIKQLTGGDRIAARFMRQDFFEYSPQFKLTVIGNHMPELHNVDDAARRRFNMGPFTNKPRVKDKRLEVKLRAEWPEILRWMIDGCLDWQTNGLIRPAIVTASTQEYFEDQDLISQWLGDCCVMKDRDGVPTKDTIDSLFTSWKTYATGRGEIISSSKSFAALLVKRGFRRVRDSYGIRGRGFLGIKVRHYDDE